MGGAHGVALWAEHMEWRCEALCAHLAAHSECVWHDEVEAAACWACALMLPDALNGASVVIHGVKGDGHL